MNLSMMKGMGPRSRMGMCPNEQKAMFTVEHDLPWSAILYFL